MTLYLRKIKSKDMTNKKISCSQLSEKKLEEKKDNGSLRYSDSDLQAFKKIVLKKLEKAQEEYAALKGAISLGNEQGTDDTYAVFKVMEEVHDANSREELSQLALRQIRFIESLQNALVRIENKTYGICRLSGKLIARERLQSVPHTTLSMDAKTEVSRQN